MVVNDFGQGSHDANKGSRAREQDFGSFKSARSSLLHHLYAYKLCTYMPYETI